MRIWRDGIKFAVTIFAIAIEPVTIIAVFVKAVGSEAVIVFEDAVFGDILIDLNEALKNGVIFALFADEKSLGDRNIAVAVEAEAIDAVAIETVFVIAVEIKAVVIAEFAAASEGAMSLNEANSQRAIDAAQSDGKNEIGHKKHSFWGQEKWQKRCSS